MKSVVTVVNNKSGLHARPAAMFSAKAKTFASIITVRNVDEDTDAVNAKSMLKVLTLGIVQGTNIELRASGEDETAAIAELNNMIAEGFGEK